MPNYCKNTLTLTHKDPAKLREAIDAWNSGEFCNHFIPMSVDLKLGQMSIDELRKLSPEQRVEYKNKCDQMEIDNLSKYGYASWYEFRTAKWGIKWDFGRDSDDDIYPTDATSLSVVFDTPWSPPEPIYKFLVEQGYEIEALFCEFGMAFCGYFRTTTDCKTYGTYDNNIPDFIDKAFHIKEQLNEVDE